MLVKVIVTLVILIAIGALGFTLLGEGVFSSVDRAAAANFAEDARDLDQMIEIYEALTAGESVFENSDLVANGGDASGAADRAEVSNFLRSAEGQEVLDGDISEEYDILAVGTEHFLITNAVGGISDDVCAEAHEIFNSAAVAFSTDLDGTLSSVTVEGACADTDGAGLNQLVFPLGE